jgi:hypothetical protein
VYTSCEAQAPLKKNIKEKTRDRAGGKKKTKIGTY